MKTLHEQMNKIVNENNLKDIITALQHACIDAETSLQSYGRATEASLLYTAALTELRLMQSRLFNSYTRKAARILIELTKEVTE